MDNAPSVTVRGVSYFLRTASAIVLKGRRIAAGLEMTRTLRFASSSGASDTFAT